MYYIYIYMCIYVYIIYIICSCTVYNGENTGKNDIIPN